MFVTLTHWLTLGTTDPWPKLLTTLNKTLSYKRRQHSKKVKSSVPTFMADQDSEFHCRQIILRRHGSTLYRSLYSKWRRLQRLLRNALLITPTDAPLRACVDTMLVTSHTLMRSHYAGKHLGISYDHIRNIFIFYSAATSWRKRQRHFENVCWRFTWSPGGGNGK